MIKRWISRWKKSRRIHAHIDQVYNNVSISGWAVDRKNLNRRVELEVLLDGKVVQRTRADIYREDLKKAFGGDGYHAFTALLDLSDLSIKKGRITLRHAASKKDIVGAEAFCSFELTFWESFKKEFFFGNEEKKAFDEFIVKTVAENRLGYLRHHLLNKRVVYPLSETEILLLFVTVLTLGDYAEASFLYQNILKSRGSSLAMIHRVLWKYCSTLWIQELVGDEAVEDLRKLEFFLMSAKEWLNETYRYREGSPSLLLGRMIRSGYLLDLESSKKFLQGWEGIDAEGIVVRYGRLLPLAKRLHQLRLVGKEKETELMELMAEISPLLTSVDPMTQQLLLVLLDLFAFFVTQELLSSSELIEIQKFLQDSSLDTYMERCSYCRVQQQRLLERIEKSLQYHKEEQRETARTRQPPMDIGTLQLLSSAKSPADEGDLACFLVQRNEAMRLEGFFDYYRNLGVKHFYVVDNASDDSVTLEFLMAQEDVELFSTSQSYAEARYGIDWIESLLRRYKREGSWNLVVDADELLVLDESIKKLPDLCMILEEEGKTALSVPLLDLYSKGPIRTARYRPGLEMLDECGWYDARFYTTYSPYGGPRGKDPIFQGGVRSRTFGIDSVVLNKTPLFFYSSNLKLREGMHWIDGVKADYGKGILLHFKYLSTFHRYVEEEVERGEHWNGASEYKRYYEALKQNPDFSLYHPVFSLKYRGVKEFFSQHPYLWKIGE